MLKGASLIFCGFALFLSDVYLFDLGKQIVADVEKSGYFETTFHISAFAITIITFILGISIRCFWYGGNLVFGFDQDPEETEEEE